MTANEIKSRLVLLGVKQVDIARRANVCRAYVNSVIHKHRQSVRLRRLIAKAIKKPYDKVWDDAA